MICKNCGKEFDGKFCPECGTMEQSETQQNQEQELTQCPQCGAERMGDGKFCINCGYNYLEPMQKAEESDITPSSGYVKPNKFLSVLAKIYRWLLAGGMLFVGIVSLLCLTAPILTENFLGEVNNLCTGFQAISGKEVDVPSQAVNASVMLLVVSLIALVYGGVQLFFAFKKPYSNTIGKKKFVFWGIDGAISLVLIILGAVVSQQTNSEELMDAKLGSGFAMAIVMGVFGLLFLGARIFYELKLFKWEDTGLSEEQVAKIREKKERKKLTKKQIMAIVIPVVTVAILIAVIVPSVSWATNIFRVGKVDKINIGDSQEQVIKILGEPFNKNEYSYEYYSDNYLKVLRQLDKLNGNERGLTAFASSDDDFDDIDWDDEDFGEDKETKLEEQLRQMTYQYIRVEFDSNKKVSSVLFDAEKCDSKEYKKVVKSYDIIIIDTYTADKAIYTADKAIRAFSGNDFYYKVEYSDKSFYKGLAVKDYVFTNTGKQELQWFDRYNNKFTKIYEVLPLERLTAYSMGIICGGDKTLITEFEIPSGVKIIDDSAFYGCSSLTSIEIPSSVTSIGDRAFYGCSSLTSIEIPSSVTSIGISAFSGCSSLTSIEIPSSVTSIGSSAFYRCSSLTSIVIPSSVTSIGNEAFSGCSSLTSIEIPSSVTSIGDGAFIGCSSLISIEIPSSVTSIGNWAFYGCISLTIYCEAQSMPSGWDSGWNSDEYGYYDIPVVWNCVEHGVTESGIMWSLMNDGDIAIIGYSVMSTEVVIPATINGHSVTFIDGGAFWECCDLKSIVIPSSVIIIGPQAFYGCSSLTSIVIPCSVTIIGDYAFQECSRLTIYCEAQSQPSGWFEDWNCENRPVVWGYKK
ncbi:MAG: leucine-rich repeat protein [Clostridia bacterium]|nr:leucine-rich repeat protein [Clostridia bacterium]